jgi:hypothetical protein
MSDDAARILGEVLSEELAYWTPRRSGEITDNLIEALASRGYVLRKLEPGRVRVREYPCTCPRGCIAHPFGPPPEPVDPLTT